VLSELFIAVAIGVVFITYANGANDNFKGWLPSMGVASSLTGRR
jgi:hypothetical protein|tara:strand:- start:163 stop:294 length:132 start_codon:yes stop_codon:yes gene_type:complete